MFSKQSAKILADRKKYLLAIPHLYITGVSQWMAHESLRTFLKDTPTYVIPNGIDMDVFKPTLSDLRKRLGLERKYVILGPASKWLSDINKEVLTKFTELMQPNEVLLLFGVDVQDTLNLPKNVITYGYTKNREELAQLYTMADVFVNCSREDSLSLINVEAQACGTPVVTFDQTGPKETVDEINSFSVTTGDTAMMYEKVSTIKHKGTEKNENIKFVAGVYEKERTTPNTLIYIKIFTSHVKSTIKSEFVICRVDTYDILFCACHYPRFLVNSRFSSCWLNNWIFGICSHT